MALVLYASIIRRKRGEAIMHCVKHWGLYELSVSGIDPKRACQLVAKEAKTWQ